MKAKRVTLAKGAWIGALGGMYEHVDPGTPKHNGVELHFDERTLLVAVHKGSECSVIRDWAVIDLADEPQEDTDAGSAGGVPGKAPRRGRPPKNPPPVQT